MGIGEEPVGVQRRAVMVMEGGYRRGEGGCPKESSYWFRLWKEGGKNLIKKGENQRFLIICKIKLCITCDDLY